MPYDPTIEDYANLFYQEVEGEPLPSVGDGVTYSRALGWQSPEGNFYGQERWVRDWPVGVVWDGEDYRSLEVDGEADSESELPIPGEINPRTGLPYGPRQHFEVWSIPRLNWPPADLEVYDGREKEFYFWNSDREDWQLIEWFWDIDGEVNLPRPGVKVGAAHVLYYYDIKVMWNGLAWVRFSHEMLDLGENDYLHLPEGFITNYEDQVSDTHGRIMHVDSLLSSHALANEMAFDGVYFDLDDIDEDIADVNEELGDIQQDISNFSSDGYITLAEANALRANRDELVAESEDLIEWAEALNIVTPKTNYAAALSNLVNTLAVWVTNPPYPKVITTEQRESIDNAIADFSAKKQVLTKALSDTTADGLTSTFLSRVSEALVEFKSKTNIGIIGSVRGSTGAIWCSGELLIADNSDDVTNEYPVLNYVDGEIVLTHIEPNTEYYVYVANYKSSEFSVPGLPADGDKPATSPRDFRGNLFLSQTSDYNGTLGETEPGLNARVVGKCETDGTDYSEGGPYFIREINMSIIGRNVDLSQAFTEYSDYQLVFVDQNTLSFQKFDGTRGLCYIAGQLLELGNGLEVDTNDYRVTWNGGYLNPMSLDTSAIAANTTYQIYLSNDEDSYNFNDINPGTGRPYQESDIGYVAAKDKRRQLFLSTKAHDHRLFDEAYPGYFARHIGQIQTDENGRFRYAADISLIRQPTLNPTHLDGLAECVIQDVSTTQFKVTRKKGTTGIIYVGGKPVQTYDSDNPLVHIVSTTDPLYEYDESDIDDPLTDSGDNVADKPGILIYLYLANDIDAWQGVTTFCSLEAPHGGYLSANWPGNQARWLATIQLAPATLGSEKVTNGSFATDTAWTKGTGWSYSSPNQNMVHTPGNAASLSQDVSAVAGELYACTFYISGRTAGIAAPSVGGVAGSPISGNTSSIQYLLARTTGDLELVPDTYFDGSVDNVSVKRVITGQFLGTYIKDSINGFSAQIDDSLVSTSTTYSSNKIEQIRQQLLGKINLALGLNGSYTAGLNLILEYIDSTTIRLRAVDSDVDVIFPNLDAVTVTTAGIYKTITGSTNTRYYVYLVMDGTLAISTNAPTDIYTKISFYGETHILVGWLGFSETNTIAGAHNVYSFWNEPQRTFTQTITSGSGNVELTNLKGLVLRPDISASVAVAALNYTGYTTFGTRTLSGPESMKYYYNVYTTSTSLGVAVSNSLSVPYVCTLYRTQTISTATIPAASSGIYATVIATINRSASSWVSCGSYYGWVESDNWSSSSTITLSVTRPGS